MGGNSRVPIDDIKSQMDALFVFASQIEYTRNHPLRIVQACKSLIGINLEFPPRVLMKWLENHLKIFSPEFTEQPLNTNKVAPETITYTHLGFLILENKVNESNEYLRYLLQSASPCHIAEYLIELAVSRSPGSLLFCWSALRSIQFVGEKDGYPILFHCLSNILEEVASNRNNTKLHFEKYELYCHQFQIRKTEIIRKNKIIPHLDKMIQAIKQELNQAPPLIIPIALENIIRKEEERGIVSYLSSLKMEEISSDLILLLDALRSVLKFSDNPEDPILLRILNNSGEKMYA